jgi:hypothetical protein
LVIFSLCSFLNPPAAALACLWVLFKLETWDSERLLVVAYSNVLIRRNDDLGDFPLSLFPIVPIMIPNHFSNLCPWIIWKFFFA